MKQSSLYTQEENGRHVRGKPIDLFQKNYDSMNMLSMIEKKDLFQLKDEVSYILVYNEDKQTKYKEEVKHQVFKRAKGKIIKFNQGFFKGYLFKTVETLNESEFEEQFLQRFSS